ncbi:RID-alpha [Simian adenovirus 13]|uniref:RID-alpha n=1 Tax=Simian adenovirus 13 TaxID=38432 RepID=A0A0M4NFN0_9ADEN|nr:RID-alpha [Simian adenovirus 13]ALE30374.1 RID-alpha [Simian adenovirus 13]
MTLALLICTLTVPVTLATVSFATATHLEPECLPPFQVYLVFSFLCCTCIASLITLLLVFFQFVDYFLVRLRYRHHAPQFQNPNVARLLALQP